MNETTPTPPEKTVVLNNNPSCRLRTLVFVSLGLNALILAILFIGFLCHLHHRGARFEDYGGRGGHFHAMDRGFGRHFHKFGMNRGWKQQDMDMCQDGSCPVMDSMGMVSSGKEGFGPGSGTPPMGGPGRGMMAMGGAPSPTEMADRMTDHLVNQLSLTDDQKTKLRPIIEQQVAQMQKLMEDTKAKINPILDADQQKKLDQLKPPGPPPPKE